jgi:protein-disulfide isomerase
MMILTRVVRGVVVVVGALVLAACGRDRVAAKPDSPTAAVASSAPAAIAAPVAAPAPVIPAPTPPKANPAAPPRGAAAKPRRIVFGYADFTGLGHDRGKPDAPVVVIDLSDFGCPYCGEFTRDVYPAIDRDYVQTGKVLFKYIPFIAGSFPHAGEATRAAECAAEQAQFWPMLDRLYATQAEWKRSSGADALVADYARGIGLDMTRYQACYADRHTDAITARGTAVANDIGVRVTPSFLVDGKPVQGALPLAEFRKLIDIALLIENARRQP